MSEWKERWENTTLNEVCDLIPGFAFKSKDFGDYPTKAIKIGDIHPPRINTDTLAGVNLASYNITKLEKFKVLKGDFILAMTGATIGKIGRYNDETPAYINQRTLRFCVNDSTDSQFIYYVVNTNYFRDFIFSHVDNLTAQPNISAGTVATYTFQLPPLEVQQKISAVLTVLDEKIELNRRLNDNLEAMAQALYDYWFVQFDFPDENGRPYKSSGGKMVRNQQLKREIPEGWEVKQIREVADTCLGGTPVTNIREYWDGGNIPWISSGDLTSNPLLQVSDYITQKGLNNSAAKLMPKGTVVVSLVRYIRPSILGIDAAGNQSVVGIFANKILPTCFLYPYVKSEVPRLMGLRTGAQQPHINKEVIDSSFIVLPDNVSIMGQYQNKALGIYEKLLCVAKERESLTKQRDFLLPLLMNGQVQVKP